MQVKCYVIVDHVCSLDPYFPPLPLDLLCLPFIPPHPLFRPPLFSMTVPSLFFILFFFISCYTLFIRHVAELWFVDPLHFSLIKRIYTDKHEYKHTCTHTGRDAYRQTAQRIKEK